MDNLKKVYNWATKYDFSDEQIQYATILALKILDDECKMNIDNYKLFMSVYDGINDQAMTPFNMNVHVIINLAKKDNQIVSSPVYRNIIHDLRIIMMQEMKKPIMKTYKNLVWSIL